MAPTRKAPERRQRRGTKDSTPRSAPPKRTAEALVPDDVADAPVVPKPDTGWLTTTRTDWDQYWSSDLARHVTDTDRPAVRRLFRLRDQLTRAQRAAVDLRRDAMKKPTVKGSQGQPVANPLFRAAEAAAGEALALETRVLALEDRFGLSPRSRLNLGIAEQQGLGLLGRNAAMARRFQEVSEGADPRTVAGDAAAKPR